MDWAAGDGRLEMREHILQDDENSDTRMPNIGSYSVCSGAIMGCTSASSAHDEGRPAHQPGCNISSSSCMMIRNDEDDAYMPWIYGGQQGPQYS